MMLPRKHPIQVKSIEKLKPEIPFKGTAFLLPLQSFPVENPVTVNAHPILIDTASKSKKKKKKK